MMSMRVGQRLLGLAMVTTLATAGAFAVGCTGEIEGSDDSATTGDVTGETSASATAAGPTVTTPRGTFPAATYQGISANGVTQFRGVRFAAAPTGNRRFAAPVPPA